MLRRSGGVSELIRESITNLSSKQRFCWGFDADWNRLELLKARTFNHLDTAEYRQIPMSLIHAMLI
jgi:hypothetical protein